MKKEDKKKLSPKTEKNSSSLFGRFTKWASRQKNQPSKKPFETEVSVEKTKTDRELPLEKIVKASKELSSKKTVRVDEELSSQKTVKTDEELPSEKTIKVEEKAVGKKLLKKTLDESSPPAASKKTEKVLKTDKEPSLEEIVETEVKEVKEEVKEPSRPQVKLSGLFAFKMEMTSFYKEGKSVPVTVLHYKPWRVSQIKTRDKEGYSAVQLACQPQKNGRCSKPLTKHLLAAGFKEGARYIKELREQELPENIQVGHELSIQSLSKGDFVKISNRSKGRGFSGVMKRWGFRGGKASHGAKTHRRPGSIGQHTEPARVFAGKKMPGHYGFQKVSLKKVEIVDILPKENLIFVKGPVPGSRNTLVTLKKMEMS